MAMSWQGCVILGHGNEVGSPPKKSRVIMLLLRMGNEVLHNACFFFCSKFSDILWKKWRITWNLCFFFWLSNACIFPQLFFWVTFAKSKNEKQIKQASLRMLRICNNSTLQIKERFFKSQCIVRHLKTHPSKFFLSLVD